MRIAESPASATKVFGMPCSGEVIQPAMTPIMIATSHRSRRLSGPMRASSRCARSRAGAVSSISGRIHRESSHGTVRKHSRPGTIEPEIQRIQVSSTCAIFAANSAISGFAAMPVRNIAEAL
jgi:hypothetical protein